MLPAFLITLREVIEASLIVATMYGILQQLKLDLYVKALWVGAIVAVLATFSMLLLGALSGFAFASQISGKAEELFEGIAMLVSAVFITWAVFYLHSFFAQYKVSLITRFNKIKDTIIQSDKSYSRSFSKGIFVLAFTSVFREGLEIVLFLASTYFSTSPGDIVLGTMWGVTVGLVISYMLVVASIRLPVYLAFRVTSVLLIMFAAGLLARSLHEFSEAGMLPGFQLVPLTFLPSADSYAAEIIKSIFGISSTMDVAQLSIYLCYSLAMIWYVFVKNGSLIKSLKKSTLFITK